MPDSPVVFSDQDIDQSGQSSKPITFGEDEIAKPSTGTALGGNPLGPGSPGYKAPAASRPAPKFSDVVGTLWNQPDKDTQASVARAKSPQTAASESAGMPLAPVAGAPKEPTDGHFTNPRTGQRVPLSAVPEADMPIYDPARPFTTGPEQIASGASDIKKAESQQVPDNGAFFTNPRTGQRVPLTRMPEAARRQEMSGIAETIKGVGDVSLPLVAASGVMAPAKTALGFGAGMLASEGAGAAVHGHVSPEDEDLIRTVSMFAPSALGVVSGLKSGYGKGPGPRPTRIGEFSAFGDRVSGGVRVTPEDVTIGAKVGDTRFGRKFSRGFSYEDKAAPEGDTSTGRTGQPRQLGPGPGEITGTPHNPEAPPRPMPSEVASMVKANASATMAKNVVAGRPAVPPPAPPPPTPGEEFGNKLSGAQVDHLAQTIAKVPEGKRNQVIDEAHQNLTQWIADNKGKVVVDGKIHIAKTPDAAEALAAKLINDGVAAHDKATAEAAKVQVKTESSQQPAKSSPEAANRTPEATSTPAAPVRQFLASSRPPKATPAQEPQAPTPQPVQTDLGETQAPGVPQESQSTQNLTGNEGAKQEVAAPKVFTENDIQPAHEYASTQVNIEPKSELGQRHTEAVAAIPEEHLGPNGKEKTPHVTVRYGLKDDSPEAIAHIKDAAAKIAPFEATVGKTGSFPATKEGAHPVIVHVEKSPELNALRSAVEGAGEFKPDDHGEYKPHVTLGYVKPEHVAKYEGGSHLEGGKIPVDHVVVSKRDGTEERIPLEGGYKYEPLTHEELPGGKTFYHGTPHGLTELKEADPVGFSGELNIYGPGLYLTDNPKVAEGYKRTRKPDEGRTEQRHVLSAELPGAKVLDLEKPLPDKVLQLFNKRIEQYTPLGMSAFPEGTKGTHIYSELRDESAAQRIPAYEIQDLLGDISQNLVEMGYHGLRHEGGRSAGKKYGPHNVVVLFPDYDSGKGTVYGNKPDRRTNVAERKRVADMKPHEMARELHTSRLDNGDGTHTEMPIPNGRAFHDAPSSPAVAMSDADALKAFNDKFGYKAGNTILVAKAEAAKEAGLDAYHQKGDEFLYRGESPEQLKAGLEKARAILRNREFTVTDADGNTVTLQGVDFSYGTGTDLKSAEAELHKHKTAREAAGERARGELRGITEVGHEAATQGGTEEVAPQTFHESEIEHQLPEGIPAKGQAGRVRVDDLTIAPKEFQYKLNTNEHGVTNLLSGQKWNDDLAGVVSIWHNPADGKTYVVNGHHRVQLAKENGAHDLLARHLNVDTAGEARATGALQNIAEGRGTAVDAAKFFRESGISPADLSKHGISLGESKAADGLALSKLDQSIFERVATGKMSEGRGVAIGQATSDPAQQEAILKLLDKREKQGKSVTDATVAELARFVGNSGNKTIEQGGLFGANQQIHSLALEKAEISAHIKAQIAKERRVFGSVATEDKASALGQVKGQKLKAEQNRKIADAAGQAEEAYNKLSSHTGPVNDILEKSAKELASGYHKPEDVKSRAYQAVRAELRKAVTGSEGQGAERVQEHPGHAEEDAGNADRQASVKPSDLEELRRPKNKSEEPTLPGMEPHVAAEKEAVAEKHGEDLSREITAPKESISTKTGEMERNSPLFRDSEASGQSGLFNQPGAPAKGETVTLADGRSGQVQYVHPEMNIARVKTDDGKTVTVGLKTLKDKSGESGFARLNVPSAVADLVKAAKEKTWDRVLEPGLNKAAKNIDDTLYQLGKQSDADVLRVIKLLKAVGPTTSPEDQAAIYHHKEDSGEALTARQQANLEGVVQPLMDANSEMRAKLNKAGVPMGEDDGYIHREVQGKNNQMERAMRGKGGTGKGNVLSKAASSLKGRRMFAAEDEDGQRVVVHRNGDTMTAFDNGSASEFAKDKPGLQVGDEFNDKDGQRWTLKQATTKEIEEHTGVRYYKNALANTVVDYLQLRRAERANDALDAMKEDPEFKSLSFKPEHGEMPPDGWRTVNLPQFNGYYFEKHLAETLDRFADELHADPAGAMEKIGNLMTASLVLNPARHVYNIGNHWLVERGVTGNFNVFRYPRSFKAGIRAIKAVVTQNDDFVQALDHGAPMMSHRQDLRELHKHLVDSILGYLDHHTDVASMLAKAAGYANHLDMMKGLYKLGQKMTWMSNDIFFLQATYEKALGGMPFEEAAAETAKHIPDYRIPSRVLNSHGLSKFMNSHMLTVFSRYHYGVWKSYGQMLKEAASPDSTWKDRARGFDHLFMLGLLTFVAYEMWDKLLKKITGDPKARMVRSGASAVPYLVNEIVKGNKPPEELIQGTFTPAVLPKTAAELAFNRDFYSGSRIYDRHAPAATIAHDVGKKITGALGPTQQVEKAERSETPTRDLLAYQAGVTFPNSETQSTAVRLMHELLRENMALTPDLQKQLDDKRARIESGDLSQKERKAQLKKQALDELSFYLPRLDRYSDVKKVFNAATPEEKAIIRPIMLKKAVSTMRGNPIEGEREGALHAFEER
ncbi:MAG TPA: 2'-5' RNA ligase family protein [Candidatus Angelobacter sp.]|jgi:2'-5' RNA ligase/GGDEF domain-containing protein|nr:2'-5' RNA ligase family protein [Candidatus Angelobacter sp.]